MRHPTKLGAAPEGGSLKRFVGTTPIPLAAAPHEMGYPTSLGIGPNEVGWSPFQGLMANFVHEVSSSLRAAHEVGSM